MVCSTHPALFQTPKLPASQQHAATAGSRRCCWSSAHAAPHLSSSHAELLSPIAYSLTLADTVVSSARQAVSKSPVSKVACPALRVLLSRGLDMPDLSILCAHLPRLQVLSMRISTFVSLQAESLNEQWVWPTEGEIYRTVSRGKCSALRTLPLW